MPRMRVQTVQEVRLPEEGIVYPLNAGYKWRNNTLEGIQSGTVGVQRSEHVEPLITYQPGLVPDEDEEVGTSHFIAETMARNAQVEAPQPDEVSTPTTEVVTPPGEVDPMATPDAGGPSGDISRRSPDDEPDSPYITDDRGYRHRVDQYGQRIRESERPPYIPVQWWAKMSYRKRKEATRKYLEEKKAAELVTRRTGSAGSRDPYPADADPLMACRVAAPLGIHGLLQMRSGESNPNAKVTQQSEQPQDVCPVTPSPDEDILEDDINNHRPCSRLVAGCEVPAMPTTQCHQEHREKIPTMQTPFLRVLFTFPSRY